MDIMAQLPCKRVPILSHVHTSCNNVASQYDCLACQKRVQISVDLLHQITTWWLSMNEHSEAGTAKSEQMLQQFLSYPTHPQNKQSLFNKCNLHNLKIMQDLLIGKLHLFGPRQMGKPKDSWAKRSEPQQLDGGMREWEMDVSLCNRRATRHNATGCTCIMSGFQNTVLLHQTILTSNKWMTRWK